LTITRVMRHLADRRSHRCPWAYNTATGTPRQRHFLSGSAYYLFMFAVLAPAVIQQQVAFDAQARLERHETRSHKNA